MVSFRVLKDGLGQLGTLVFGKTIAHNFDIHSKSWCVRACVHVCMQLQSMPS